MKNYILSLATLTCLSSIAPMQAYKYTFVNKTNNPIGIYVTTNVTDPILSVLPSPGIAPGKRVVYDTKSSEGDDIFLQRLEVLFQKYPYRAVWDQQVADKAGQFGGKNQSFFKNVRGVVPMEENYFLIEIHDTYLKFSRLGFIQMKPVQLAYTLFTKDHDHSGYLGWKPPKD